MNNLVNGHGPNNNNEDEVDHIITPVEKITPIENSKPKESKVSEKITHVDQVVEQVSIISKLI